MGAMGAAMTHDELLNNSSDSGTKVPMTHDELLAKINLQRVGSFSTENEKRRKALRAVVKRHYPFEFHLGDVMTEIQCFECQRKYPCGTIKDIEKELN